MAATNRKFHAKPPNTADSCEIHSGLLRRIMATTSANRTGSSSALARPSLTSSRPVNDRIVTGTMNTIVARPMLGSSAEPRAMAMAMKDDPSAEKINVTTRGAASSLPRTRAWVDNDWVMGTNGMRVKHASNAKYSTYSSRSFVVSAMLAGRLNMKISKTAETGIATRANGLNRPHRVRGLRSIKKPMMGSLTASQTRPATSNVVAAAAAAPGWPSNMCA